MTTKKPTRRPRHAYSPELTDLICERLLDGTSLRQICQDKNMPARSAIFVWLAKHKEFARNYMIANDPGLVEAGNEAQLDRVPADAENNWNCRGCRLGGYCRNVGQRGNDGYPAADQINSHRRQPIGLALCPAVLDRYVLAFDVAGFAQTPAKCGHLITRCFERLDAEEPDHRHALLSGRPNPCSLERFRHVGRPSA